MAAFSQYASFIKRVGFIAYQNAFKAIFFGYKNPCRLLTVFVPINVHDNEYLMIIIDDSFMASYIRYDKSVNIIQ